MTSAVSGQLDAFDGLVINLFAGAGGACAGIEAALGRKVDIAINHDPVALAVHKANHPSTYHVEEDIWKARPLELTKGRPVELLWASPDCTHFSMAKGGKPRSAKKRTLAWAVYRWAKFTRPRRIFCENVREFESWGPLTKEGFPDKRFLGKTFRAWRRRLERLGYRVDHRMLDASLYGAPTRRRRLFIMAMRADALNWPAPTHGEKLEPVHTAAECIDWDLECPSIFERWFWNKKAKEWEQRPLKEKTQWRIARGLVRFVFEDPEPFIIKVNHGKDDERVEPLDEPLTTVTASRRGHALVMPFLARTAHGDVDRKGKRRGKGQHPVTDPLPAITTSGDCGIVIPTLIQTGYGEREGQDARVPGLRKPLGTIVAGGGKHALVAAFVAKHFGDRGQRPGAKPDEPLPTVTASDHHSLAAVHLLKMRGKCHSSGMREPAPTMSAQGTHIAQVRAFLTAYHASDYAGGYGQSLRKPMRALTTKHRLGLVTIHGVDYQITDICMRMLEPHELLAAQFGRYAEKYDLSCAIGERKLKLLQAQARRESRSVVDLILAIPKAKRRPTKTAKVRLIGNTVCPDVAYALVAANITTKNTIRRAA